LQAFVKSGLDVSGKRIVVAGTGPLLLAVAAGLARAGARIVTIVEQAPLSRLARFLLSLLWGHAGKLIEGAGYGWSTRGISYRTGQWVSGVSGDGHVEGVRITTGSREREFKADMLAIGFHLIANTELARMLNCKVEAGLVRVDQMQQTSVQGIYCVGETTGIGGIDKALVEGQIAGFAIAGQLDRATALIAARDRQKRFARRLALTFALREELRTLARNETIVCRCEDVAHESLRDCRTWREAKLHTRCGMGPCQGRICGPATEFLYGWDSPLPRPPLFPTDLSALSKPFKETPSTVASASATDPSIGCL
jgi:NADPH-dependent 2,4-dienoyl-CoA reductase/sulfur reductase-like enzyme